MYTGITRGTFPIVAVEHKPGLLTYVVELDAALLAGLQTGASISIDGVCQTVTAVSGQRVTIDAIQESLDLSTLDTLEVGRRVAVERSARVGDEIGGHDIAGHVNGMGVVSEVHRNGNVFDLQIEVPREWTTAIFEKGFIAVDGSSLTVEDVRKTRDVGSFALHLIPETLRLTNLGRKQRGDRVNIELDARTVAIVRTVERVLEARSGAIMPNSKSSCQKTTYRCCVS
jgi:riboflavin synthase